MIRVCFVCLGNICRSPIAAGVMRHLVLSAGLDPQIQVESAGTAGYHQGERPDPRARAAGVRRGIAVDGHARKFRRDDFQRFDYVLALDGSNYEDLSELRSASNDAKLYLLRSFDPASPRGASVPDPYYGGDAGFDEVLELCLAACAGLLERIRAEHGL